MKKKKSGRPISKKLGSRKGETLIEVMVAMVIGVFSCILLAQVISTSTGLDSSSRTLFAEYYDVNNKLSKAFAGEINSGLTAKRGNIIITGNNIEGNIVYRSEYYVNDVINGEEVIAYRIAD